MSEARTMVNPVAYEWGPPRGMRGIPFSRQQRPALPESEWRRIDDHFEKVSSLLSVNVHLILTDRSAHELCHGAYVYLEPLGHIVITLSYVEHKAEVWTDPSCWHEGWATTCDEIAALLQQDRLVDALLHALDAAHAYAPRRTRPTA